MNTISSDAKLSIANALRIVDDSIKILRDTDELLDQPGWEPVHGNTIGSEHSKSIKQMPSDLGRFFPNYMSRYYYRNTGRSQLVLAANIQLFHPWHPELEPSIWPTVLTLESSYDNNPPVNIFHWLVKSAIFETDKVPVADGTTVSYQGSNGLRMAFFGMPWRDIQAKDDVQQRIVNPLLDLAEQEEKKRKRASIEKLRSMQGEAVIVPRFDKLDLFLTALFGTKRLLILQVGDTKQQVMERLKAHCLTKGIEFLTLDGSSLTEDDIKGAWEIKRVDGQLYSDRMKASYISSGKQMIVVENLPGDSKLEVLRAFCYMAFLEGYYDDIENLPADKLPYGSAYVFLAEDTFPLKQFASISDYWRDESAVLDLR